MWRSVIYIPDKEFKIALLRNLTKLSENTERPFNETRKTIHEQNEKFNRGRNHKIKKKISIPETLELKNAMNE